MAEKRRFFDVWITETNTVYREVPFPVVTDWVQGGRLLVDDKLRPSGTAEWFRLGDLPGFAAYLPQSEPYRAEDQAEALEPVALEFQWRKSRPEDEGEVDMIPLIDVSLVLIIFFLMTASLAAKATVDPTLSPSEAQDTTATEIRTPEAYFGRIMNNPEAIWIGIERDQEGAPVYSLGTGNNPPAKADQGLMTLSDLMKRLDDRLRDTPGSVDVNVRADRDLPSGVVRRVQIELERRPLKIGRKFIGVQQKATS
jgi:biopolymer transport protein ExbD